MGRKQEYAGVRFELPDGLVDRTVLTFLDDPSAVRMSFTVSQEPFSAGQEGLARYVAEQVRAIAEIIPGYTVTAQSNRPLTGGRMALLVDARLPDPSRIQRQAYLIDDKGKRVVVATATAVDADIQRAKDTVDGFLSSVDLGGAS